MFSVYLQWNNKKIKNLTACARNKKTKDFIILSIKLRNPKKNLSMEVILCNTKTNSTIGVERVTTPVCKRTGVGPTPKASGATSA